MRAAQRNAKIAQAKVRRPFRWVTVERYSRRLMKVVARRVRVAHKGDGPLRLCVGEAPVAEAPVVVPKHVLRKQRQRAQRARESLRGLPFPSRFFGPGGSVPVTVLGPLSGK